MTSVEYRDPVSKLLSREDRLSAREAWPDYRKMGLTREHIPDLIVMLTDEDLHFAPSESPKVWAPVHAWRALGQLGAVEALEPLLGQLRRIDDEGDDAVGEEMPHVFGMIGVEAVGPVGAYLRSRQHGIFARVCAAHSLEKIGNAHPQVRDRCVEILTRQLAEHDLNDPMLNGFVVHYLVCLHAVESLDVIREAYRNERVDIFVTGDVEKVEMKLGIRTERSTPVPTDKWLQEVVKLENAGLEERDGESAVKPSSSQLGRNDPCHCGSGRKYKVCCLRSGR